MIFYRSSSFVYRHKILRYLLFWYLLLYKFIIGWVLNIGLNYRAIIGRGLKIQYGFGTVIDGNTIIGQNCNLRQLTNISSKIIDNGKCSAAPKIGDNVDIGVNVVIIGDIKIGNNVVIGAGAIITKDVEDNCVMVGNPAVVLKRKYVFPNR